MSERVRAYVTGEPPDRVWTNDSGEVIAAEGGDPIGRIEHEPGELRQTIGLIVANYTGSCSPALAERLAAEVRARADRVRVGSEREGWRARLANVERELDQSLAEHERRTLRTPHPEWILVERALAEVRSMIDGDEVPS